ncbi:MAG: tetratricopeptide repeat protein [Planctomycetota bacterium]|nr:tetratricopeptide repeat protein [Planctomycetota bacterium]
MSVSSFKAPALVAAAVIVAHLNILGGEFVFDDIPIVRDNPRIRSLDRLGEIFSTTYWGDEIEAGLYRPITLTTYLIDYQIWGDRAWGYRLGNLLLHLANSLVVLLFLNRIGLGRTPGLIGALIFAVHPTHAEAVTAVVGRADLLATLLVLVSLLLLIRYRSSAGGWGCLLGIGSCFLGGLLCKEVMICLPLLFIACDLLVDRGDTRRVPGGRRARPYVVLAAVLAIYLPVRMGILGALGPQGENTVFFGESLIDRWGTMLGVLFDYVAMFLFPVNLAAEFPYLPGSVPGFDIRSFLGLGILVALGVGAFRWGGARGVAISLFLFGLAPVSNVVIVTGVVKAARLLYLPSVGLSAIAGWIIWRAGAAQGRRSMILALALVLLAGLNLQTSSYWLNNETLWRRTLRIEPDSTKGLYNLGAILATRGETEEAERLWNRAREINARDSGIPLALGRLYLGEERYPEAEASFYQTLRLNPPRRRAIDAFLGLAEVFAGSGSPDTAAARISELVAAYPDAPEGYSARGMWLARAGRWGEAMESFTRAIQLDPGRPWDQVQIGLCLYQMGRPAEALVEYEKARSLLDGTELGDLLVKMGDGHVAKGDRETAIDLYREATEIDPDSGPAWNNLGQVLFILKRNTEAKAAFSRTKEILPGRTIIDLRLGELAIR